jgi:cell division septation protein DedD
VNEANEPSYYEIALTNRQVVVVFVALLTFVLAIFLCGVWVGKNGSERLARAGMPSQGAQGAEADQLANLEEFKFFSEAEKRQAAGGPGASPTDPSSSPPPPKADLPRILDKPRTDTTLAQDVGSASEASPPAAGEASGDPQPGVAGPDRRAAATEPPPSRPAPPADKAPVTPSSVTPRSEPATAHAAAAMEGWVVQVFSTHDEPQARKLLRQLEEEGQPAFLSTLAVGGQSMFRVRVGPFDDRNRAESVSNLLRQKLRLDPWVTAAAN